MKILSAEFAGASHVPGRYPPSTLSEIAFAGRSNVGKSSLLNALLHRKGLARISRTPGRTQAIQFYRVSGRFFFVDLPGYGYARAPEALRRAWRPLVEGYLDGRASLCAVVVILDIRHEPAEGDIALLDYLAHHGIPAVVVLSKADKLPRGRQAARALAIARALAAHPPIPPTQPILFSATTGQGKDALWRAIRARLPI